MIFCNRSEAVCCPQEREPNQSHLVFVQRDHYWIIFIAATKLSLLFMRQNIWQSDVGDYVNVMMSVSEASNVPLTARRSLHENISTVTGMAPR